MSTFGTFILHQEYEAVAARGDPLSEIKDLINWELFRPRLSTLYKSERDQGGRPPTDVIVLMRIATNPSSSLILYRSRCISDR